jgi:hypothetical protein
VTVVFGRSASRHFISISYETGDASEAVQAAIPSCLDSPLYATPRHATLLFCATIVRKQADWQAGR